MEHKVAYKEMEGPTITLRSENEIIASMLSHSVISDSL